LSHQRTKHLAVSGTLGDATWRVLAAP